MFTPEFVIPDRGECILVANHSLESDEAVQLSIDFVIARIAYGKSHLPPGVRTCRVVYDIRGQQLAEAVTCSIAAALESSAQVEFKRG